MYLSLYIYIYIIHMNDYHVRLNLFGFIKLPHLHNQQVYSIVGLVDGCSVQNNI